MHEIGTELGAANPVSPSTSGLNHADSASDDLITRDAHGQEIPSPNTGDAKENEALQVGPSSNPDLRAERLLAWERALSKWSKIRRVRDALSGVWATAAAFAVAATIAILVYVMITTGSPTAGWTELCLCLFLALWHVARLVLRVWAARCYAVSRRLSRLPAPTVPESKSSGASDVPGR